LALIIARSNILYYRRIGDRKPIGGFKPKDKAKVLVMETC